MKDFITGTALDVGSTSGIERHESIPFLGFMAGILLSAGLWLGIALAVWVVHP